jgi:hypothetical protein
MFELGYRGAHMDWIEKVFGISPDGGNGATEALFVAAGIAIAALILSRVPAVRGYARRALARRT